jgi:hypothetical protein
MWVDIIIALVAPQIGTFAAILLVQALNLI